MKSNRYNARISAFVIAVCIGILASFFVWEFVWTLENRESRSYGAFDNVSSLSVSRISNDGDNSTEKLFRVLVESKSSVIIDGLGDGLPGLLVLDPAGLINWMVPSEARMPRKQITDVFLFEGSYCAQQYAKLKTCSLLPHNAQVVRTLSAPSGIDFERYAYIPMVESSLPGGRYVFSHSSHKLLDEVQDVLEENGYEIQSVSATPLWYDLVTNSLMIISTGMFFVGNIFVAIYWDIAYSRRRGEINIRIFSGASRSQITVGLMSEVMWCLSGGCVLGVILSIPLVNILSGDRQMSFIVLRMLLVAFFLSILTLTLEHVCETHRIVYSEQKANTYVA